MFEDDLEGISDDDIENILDKDEGPPKVTEEKKTEAVEEKAAVAKQPAKVDALDIAWDSLRGEEEEKPVESVEKTEESELGKILGLSISEADC